MSPACQNCGAFVTSDYVRVFADDGDSGVECCPHCEDRRRDGGGWQPARAPRERGHSGSGDGLAADGGVAPKGGDES